MRVTFICLAILSVWSDFKIIYRNSNTARVYRLLRYYQDICTYHMSSALYYLVFLFFCKRFWTFSFHSFCDFHHHSHVWAENNSNNSTSFPCCLFAIFLNTWSTKHIHQIFIQYMCYFPLSRLPSICPTNPLTLS